MVKFFYSALLILLLTTNIAGACSWGPPTLPRLNNTSASMVTSENNKFLLKMLPSRWEQKGRKYFKVKESIGTVFELEKNGDFQYFWNTKDVSPFEVKARLSKSEYFTVLVSNDGKRVVKIKQYGARFDTNEELLKNKSFLTIYNQGKISHRLSYLHVFKKLPSPLMSTCPGAVWVSDIKLEDNLLLLKSGYSSLKNSKTSSVDIASGKVVK